MTTQEMIDQVEINVNDAGASTLAVFQIHKIQEDRANQAICQDLSDLSATLNQIQACKNGVCALNWKPAKQ